MQALSASLERQIATLCASHSIEPVPIDSGAPDTLSTLLEQARAEGLALSIPVWSGASDRTIWSTPEANWMFRAWHDSHHILLGAEFDLAGELRVALYACAQIVGKLERATLWAELWGQVCYYEAHGEFPEDQCSFVRACLAN